MARQSRFFCVRVEGALLTHDQLKRIVDGEADQTAAADFMLAEGEKVTEAVSHAWERAQKYWHAFQAGLRSLAPDDTATSLTRERWLYPLFSLLGYGPLATGRDLSVDGSAYAISHKFQSSPIHLLGCRAELDRRTAGMAGAARMSPHSLTQEYLNKSGDSLWGVVSNGFTLRLLRDNAGVARMSYLEFDLLSMMETQSYGDFVLLWMLLHYTSMQIKDDKPESCRLEAWARDSRQNGVRALDSLRTGVEAALRILGTGFLMYPGNGTLKEQLRDGTLSAQEFLHQLMRLVYRLIFLFVAEDRDLLLLPSSKETDEARRRYLDYYATTKLRHASRGPRDISHHDLWEGLKTLMSLLKEGYAPLAIPAFGSFLWSDQAMPSLVDAKLTNEALLTALKNLSFTNDSGGTRQAVDWKNLGSEELGSIYESLLEYIPAVRVGTDEPFTLFNQAGNERKTTGSYYTPSSLISSLLDTALEPVIAKAVQGKPAQEAARALLNLKICDPSCGSGHFLVAAAHRIARRLATLQTGETEPAPQALRAALRQVVSHCLYGVDLNPMSVELCKVALWMEAMEQGKPLSFLDHHIKCGNSLIGATPAAVARGIPTDAFQPVTGDDPALCTVLRKRNKEYRANGSAQQINFLAAFDMGLDQKAWQDLCGKQASLDSHGEETLQDVLAMERDYTNLRSARDYQSLALVLDAWCAAFTQKKVAENKNILDDARFAALKGAPEQAPLVLKQEIMNQRENHRFFHWHLEFMDVFRPGGGDSNSTGWEGGFNVVLGNPPWETLQTDEETWFRQHDPAIASAQKSDIRKKMIACLQYDNPRLLEAFEAEKRRIETESKFFHASARYPLGSVGKGTTYAVFAELNRTLLSSTGRAGFIVPSEITTAKGTSRLYGDLASKNQIISLYSFVNRLGLFPAVDSRQGFSLVTLAGTAAPSRVADYAFYLEKTEDLNDHDRHFALSGAELRLFNPNTGNCPTFRNGRDKELAGKLYRQCPVLMKEDENGSESNPWSFRFKEPFNMGSGSSFFCTKHNLETQGWMLIGNRWTKDDLWMVPLYEGKMINLFDNRFATFESARTENLNSGQLPKLTDEDHANPWCLPMPRYWVSAEEMNKHLEDSQHGTVCFRDIARATDGRTMIACIAPWAAFGDTAPLMVTKENSSSLLLSAVLSSFVFDYVTRLSVGGIHVNFFIIKQLPALTLPMLQSNSVLFSLLEGCALELSYTSWDLYPFVRDKLGYNIPPFRWEPARRRKLEVLLNAICAHYYGVDEADLSYILDTFGGVKRDEEALYGSFRLKDEILSAFTLVKAIDASTLKNRPLEGSVSEQLKDDVSRHIVPFIDPPPGSHSQCHPFPPPAEAESKMPWIDWSSLPG